MITFGLRLLAEPPCLSSVPCEICALDVLLFSPLDHVMSGGSTSNRVSSRTRRRASAELTSAKLQ